MFAPSLPSAAAYMMPTAAGSCTVYQHNSKRCANENCQKEDEKTWRKANGQIYCNACACYLKEHRRQRPLHLIQRTQRRSPPAQAEAGQETAQLMTASSLESDPLHTAPLRSSPGLDRYPSSCVSEDCRPQLYHAALPPLRTRGSRSIDEDGRPASSCGIAAAPTQRAKRARTCSFADSDFVAGVPDSPQSCKELSPTSSLDCEPDAAEAAVVLFMMKTGQEIQIPQCMTSEEEYKPADTKPQRKRRVDAAMRAVCMEEGEVKQCANCGTTGSGGGAWRRYKGARMCNACGVYPKQKEHLGEMRPVSCIEKAARKARQMKARADTAYGAAYRTASAPVALTPLDTPRASDSIEAYYHGGLPSATVQVVMEASPPLMENPAGMFAARVACAVQSQAVQSQKDAVTVPLHRALFVDKE